jgi:SNF2 family DNA or RNA helicase
MASGFVYNSQTVAQETAGKFTQAKDAVWFSPHKFDLLDDILAENQRDNTIVVYNYREELAELRRRYPHAATVDEPDAIARWNAGKIQLLLIHPKSAGHGLNLQHGGNKMVFVSLPWSLELYEQTVGRLHRGGQTKPVWAYVLLSNKTIDERIWAALYDKRAVSDIALDELKGTPA